VRASPLFAGVEQLIHEIFFDADVPVEHELDEPIGKPRFFPEQADHVLFQDDQNSGRRDGRRGAHSGPSVKYKP
jgi:hypothetical protein